MANIHNFENEFRMHIENVVPKIIGKHTREEQIFAELTLPLYTILGVVGRVLATEDRDYFGIEYSSEPARDSHHILGMEISIENLVDSYEFSLHWVGGDAKVSLLGFREFAGYLTGLKGLVLDVAEDVVKFDIDADPQKLAEGFASVFLDFYIE